MDVEEARWVRPGPPPDEEFHHKGPGPAALENHPLARAVGLGLFLGFAVLLLLAALGWL